MCVLDVQGDEGLVQLGRLLEDEGVDTDAAVAVEARARATWAARERLDERITAVAERWTTKRMTSVDRNTLRVGTFELTESRDVPPKVAINEAVEIAREYGGENSPRFVNGVLDAIRMAAERGADNEASKGETTE